MRVGELTCLLQLMELGGLARAMGESLSLWCRCGRASRLTSPATTHSQRQSFELVHPKIYIICEELKGWTC